MRHHIPGLTADLSPCIEWLFADGDRPFADRVRRAADAGFARAEFWGTTDKDVSALERAIRETRVVVSAFVSEPAGRLVDPATHDEFLAGVASSSRLAHRLNARGLIVLAGQFRAGVPRRDQRAAIVEGLRRAAPIASAAGTRLYLEPLNTRTDHEGYFLDSTAEGLDIVREVGHPSVTLLYDMYHSVVMGEEPAQALGGSGHLVGHVHLADAPGRHEPGTGRIDWPRQLAALHDSGYSGPIGLEYRPTTGTEASLEYIRALT